MRTGWKRMLARARRVGERSFCDRMTIFSASEVRMPWGESRPVWEWTKADIPCRLSYRPKAAQMDGLMGKTIWEAVLLYPAAEELGIGSRVEVRTARGRTLHFRSVGVCVAYPTHNESRLLGEGEKE